MMISAAKAEEDAAQLCGRAVLVYFITSACLGIYLAEDLPLSAWDALSTYTPTVITLTTSNLLLNAVMSDLHALFTLPLVDSRSLSLNWPLLRSCLLATIIVGLILEMSNRHSTQSVGVLTAVLCITMPLVANHILLVGYAECLIATLLTLVCHFLLSVHAQSAKLNYLCALLVGACIVIIKDIGRFYVIGLSCTFIILQLVNSTHLQSSKSEKIRSCHIKNFVIFMIIVTLGASQMLVIIPDDYYGWLLTFSGRSLPLSVPDISAAFESLVAAILLNQSFSVAFLLYAMMLSSTARNSQVRNREVHSAKAYLAMFIAVPICALLTPYGIKYGSPGSDTSFSRLFLVSAIPCAYLSAYIINRIKFSRGLVNT